MFFASIKYLLLTSSSSLDKTKNSVLNQLTLKHVKFVGKKRHPVYINCWIKKDENNKKINKNLKSIKENLSFLKSLRYIYKDRRIIGKVLSLIRIEKIEKITIKKKYFFFSFSKIVSKNFIK